MKHLGKQLLAGVTFFLILSHAQAGLLFTYHQLALKDLDQINKIIKDKVTESRKAYSGKAVPLKEALQAVFSRPNEDGMIDKVLGPLRAELDDNEAWEDSIEQLTTEAMNSLKNTKAFKADVQVTYALFLNNVISEFKPHLKTDKFSKKIIEKIAGVQIEITKEAKAERNLRMMKDLVSPSENAKRALKLDDEASKKEDVKGETVQSETNQLPADSEPQAK